MSRRPASDCLFLAVLVILLATPYVLRLGFYGDDWAFLALLLNAPDPSLAGLVAVQFEYNANLRMRPLQIAYQAVLFKAFGLSPLGYHVVNTSVLASAALLLHFTLRELDVPRKVAVSVAAVYLLSPSYATNRFWFAAFGYPLSTALCVGGAYALLRAIRSTRQRLWIAVGVSALSGAALGMEIVLPLIAAMPGVLWLRYRRHVGADPEVSTDMRPALLLACSPLVVVIGAVFYKAAASEGSSLPEVARLGRLVLGSLAVNAGTFGVALPHTVAWSLRHLSWESVTMALVLAVLVFLYVLSSGSVPRTCRLWTQMVFSGGIVFVLGIAIFLVTPRIAFWSIGTANRVWVAAAMGTALMLVGAAGWVSAQCRKTFGNLVFSTAVAGLCASGFIVNTALAGFWTRAWPLEHEVLRRIREALPMLPPRTVVILHGSCPYVGPAPVFESPWDLGGALRIAYADDSLRADVIVHFPQHRFGISEEGVWTRIYGVSSFYPYGSTLLLFDAMKRTAVTLTDAEVARAHLSEPAECPPGTPGAGTVMMPVDTWYHSWVER